MHKAHSLTIHNDGVVDPVHLPDIISHSFINRPTVQRNVPSYGSFPNHLSLMEQTIGIQMDVFSVEETLDLIGVNGLCIDADTNIGARLNLVKYDPCGDIATGSVHRGLLCAHGQLVPTRLQIDHRGDARLSLEMYPIMQGGNALISTTDALALPTITIDSARWTLGKMTIGGYELTDYTQLDVNFGAVVEPRGVESNPFNTSIEILRSEPEIMIRGIKPEWFAAANIPLGGKALTHANTSIFLRKRDPDGIGFSADASLVHLKFSMHGVALVEQISGSTEDRFTETGLMLYGREDTGGNNPLTYTGGVAIV